MRLRILTTVALSGFAVLLLAANAPAEAACKKLGFTVNHYGKKGPTADSKRLLDGYIASWAAKRGIKKFRKSKKTVSCYQFLDFGFFDEWTCKAVTNVCFRGPIPPDPQSASNNNKKKIAHKKARNKKARRRIAKRHADRNRARRQRKAKAMAAARKAKAAARKAELAAKKAEETAKKAALVARKAAETARKARAKADKGKG